VFYCFFFIPLSFRARRPSIAILFPYTTLFRSHRFVIRVGVERGLKFLERFTLQLRLQSLGLSDLLGDCPFGLLLGLGLSDKLLRSEEHTSELQSRFDLVCRLLLEQNKKNALSW